MHNSCGKSSHFQMSAYILVTDAQTQRLTTGIRRSLVTMLRTPCLLAMFSKDLISASFAQVTIRALAMLEPKLIMPQVVERAIGGLEIVNETHRTTAVLSTLAIVALPLVSERIWFGGQNHLMTLLELALPGIDMASCLFSTLP